MTITVVPFARLRELMAARSLDVPPGATVGAAWDALCAKSADLAALRGSTRSALNGRFAEDGEPLHEGDELALLPPFGGG